MMDNISLRSEEEEGSGNSLEKLLEPVVVTNSENIAVKIEECREDKEYFEEGFDPKLKVNTKHGLLDVKPKVENNLEFRVKPEPDMWVAINRLKAKNKKMRVDLWLAQEKEKKMLEKMKSKDEEMKSKDEKIKSKDDEIVELKQSVESWKKKAESRRQEHKVVEQSQSPRECYVRVNKVKMPSPPCPPPADEARAQAGSLAPSPRIPAGADTGTREEEVEAGGELEEKHGESSSHLRRRKLSKTGKKLHSCSTCQKAFLKKGNLKQHLRTHNGEKPYSCDVCPMSFSQKCNLKTHLHTHSGEKRYSCDICLTSFSQKINLKCHLRTHSGEKPYSCVICKEAFSHKRNMKRHELTHSRKKPHVCQICHKGFTRHGKLKVHKLIHKSEDQDMDSK